MRWCGRVVGLDSPARLRSASFAVNLMDVSGRWEGVCEMYEEEMSGELGAKCSSSGPRVEQMSEVGGVEGVQWGVVDVFAEGSGSETMVQRQCDRVGAADVGVVRRRVVVRSEMADETSILGGFAREFFLALKKRNSKAT
jgi:hypothetical protein